jgi:hypothetical protein
MMQPVLTPLNMDTQLPTHEGYISVAPSKRYFQDERGQGFVVIGHNDAITWPGLMELLDGSSYQTTEDYIRDLRAHGINVSRVMIEYAQYENGYFENPVGEFVPAVVQFWDEFIALAEKHGLYLLLTPYDTFWQVRNWKTYPYNADLGGPCRTMRDWLTSPDVIAAHKARWDFMLRRWGGSSSIFAWDIMNEIDLYWGSTAEEISAYITEMAAYIRQTEMALYGKTHLLTTSSAEPTPTDALGHVIYNHPSLDFANTHLYVGPGINTPLDAVECVEEMVSGVRLSLQSVFQTRPYFDSESGPIYQWIEEASLDKEYHHNMSWAHLMTGGAGSGMRWPYTTPHWLIPELRTNLLGLARFAATIDWSRFASRSFTQHIRVGKPGILRTGCTDSKTTALIWLLSDGRLMHPPSLEGTRISIANALPDGDYTIEVWETYNGTPLTCFETSIVDGKMQFELPDLDDTLRDVALIVRRVD